MGVERGVAVLIALVLQASLVQAQASEGPAEEAEESCALICDLGGDFQTFGTSRDTAALLGLGLGLSLLAKQADAGVAGSRVNSQLHPDTALDRLLEPGEIGGSTPVQLGGAALTLAVGELAGADSVSRLGSALLRAQLLNGVVSTALKLGIRRERPDGGDRRSFPSGHTSGTFATATILQRELGWKAGVPGFAFAALVGASRLSENRHYLSDVVFGAALGIAAGLSVGLESEERKLRLRPQLVAGGFGLQLSFSIP